MRLEDSKFLLTTLLVELVCSPLAVSFSPGLGSWGVVPVAEGGPGWVKFPAHVLSGSSGRILRLFHSWGYVGPEIRSNTLVEVETPYQPNNRLIRPTQSLASRTYDVAHHLEKPASTSTSNTDPHHETNDSLVVMWMYSTISPKLVDMVIDDTTLAHEVWDRLKDLFHNNKDARIIQLDNEIRNMAIGSMSVTDYFQEVKSKADRLANLGSKVGDSSLVTYTINGLRARFPELVRIIRHKEPLPTFDQVRSMILLEESDMAQLAQALSSTNLTSSSPTVLVATTTSNPKSGNMVTSGGELCRNFQRGSCTYGSRCKFIHGSPDVRSRSTNSGVKSQGSTPARASQSSNREQSTKPEVTTHAPVVPHSFFGMSGMQFVNPYLFTQPGMYSMQQPTMLQPSFHNSITPQPTMPQPTMLQPQQAHLATQVPQQAHAPVHSQLGHQAQYPAQPERVKAINCPPTTHEETNLGRVRSSRRYSKNSVASSFLVIITLHIQMLSTA
ncbi:hypothetical protein CTI12_AA443210 [Artemisia annua]|uniref:C3H1-type domain-containing protein n=1 Tax=Artemisia annua TaxID=35608 RepID=A0A2U1LRC1_ARTAN|nr:hypothetical protein CTI12_AA443210 [Artemisia annua]